MKLMSIFVVDSYKQFHYMMYPKGMTKLYSNMTPRSYKRLGTKHSVFFGLQYYVKEYLIKQWNENFFQMDLQEVLRQYRRFHKNFSAMDVTTEHIEKLHNLGYLPIKIKALPEGSLVPEKVPYFTITNTHPDFGWLVNFLETQMSTVIWDMCVNASIAHKYHDLLMKWAVKTGDESFVQWQGHDFSMRGRSSVESCYNQAGHLLSFTGTDTIPAVFFLEEYYGADMDKELIGASVPASEHSVVTSYGKENEIEAFERILDQFPTGIVSMVSDSFDLWKVCTEYVVTLKEKILGRDGKLTIRPDSGDPVDIICGAAHKVVAGQPYRMKDLDEHGGHMPIPYWYTPKDGAKPLGDAEVKGVVELLWDAFGGTVNEKGYKVLDPHIGAIYGDAITPERAEQICTRLAEKGFASTNIVLGIGSYTYNANTRDTIGLAMKATYCEVVENGVTHQREIFKDPITDEGTKKSARGLLQVVEEDGELVLRDRVNWEEEREGLLATVFLNGKLVKEYTLQEVRAKLNG